MPFLKHQIARYMGSLPLFAAPQLSGVPYVAPDVWTGDTVDFVNAPLALTVYPPPATTNTIFVNGTSRGAAPYVVTGPDVTAGNLVVHQNAANSQGFSNAASVAVNPILPLKFAAYGLLGGNAGLPGSATVLQHINNAGQCGSPFYAYLSTSTAYAGSLDANGWPLAAFTYKVSSQNGPFDGQVTAGSKLCSYRCPGQTSNVTANLGCTVSGLTNINPNTGTSDGITRYFTLVAQAAANVILNFDGPVQYLNIPRDGVTETWGGPEFWPTDLAFFSQQGVVRLMDLCNANCTEVSWSDRNILRPEYSPLQPTGSNGSGQSFSWERILRFIKALVQYPGSVMQKAWICVPGLLDPTLTASNNYAYQLPQLANSVLGSQPLIVEAGDEPWNPGLGDGHIYRGELNLAEGETKCLPYYLSETSNISSIVGNGDGTVTVSVGAAFTGAINGTTMSLSTPTLTGNVYPGQTVIGSGVTGGTMTTGPLTTVNTSGVSGTAGNTFVSPVSWATTAVVGQIITITGMGAAGGTLTTTVAAGSTGTTLNISNAVVTSNSNQTVTSTTVSVSPAQTVASTAINTQQPLSSIPMADGSTLAITNGMQMICNHQELNSTWGAGSVTPAANYAGDGTVTAVTVTTGGALAANQFKYTANGSPSGTLAAPSASNQMAFFFNLTSNLIKSGVSLSIYSLGSMAHVRRTFQTQQIWSTYRPQDQFVINVQQYATTPTAGGLTTSPAQFAFARYLGGGSAAWLYGVAEAPYVKPSGLVTTGVATVGGTTITGVPWASTAIVGDQIKVAGAGASGATLTTTVAAGSSGTTLNIADTILTTVTAPQITYVYGPSATVTASIDGTTGIMTVTSGSGLMVGMMANGTYPTTATLAFGTRIVSQIDATHWQLNIPQSVASTSMAFAQTDGLVAAMVSAVSLFSQTLAGHIYTCLRWGVQPLCYEAGPDIQNFPLQQVAIYTNPGMQALVTNLVAVWANQGGKEFCFYNWCPAQISNGTSGTSQNWQALQSYTDTSAPKHAALAGFSSNVLAYADSYSPGLVFGPSGSAGSYTQGLSMSDLGWQGFNTTNGMSYCSGNSTDRSKEILRCLPRGRRYGIKVQGSDSAAGTTADIYLDDTPMGFVTLPNNGVGSSNGTTAGDSTTLLMGELTRGAHRIRVDFPVGRGANVGLKGITLVKY